MNGLTCLLSSFVEHVCFDHVPAVVTFVSYVHGSLIDRKVIGVTEDTAFDIPQAEALAIKMNCTRFWPTLLCLKEITFYGLTLLIQ